jgi:putative peptidoglycan lipid II flippase
MLPIVLLSGVATLWGAVLQSEQRFWLVSAAAIFIPLSAGLVALGGGASWGIHALAVGTLVGFAIQATLLGWAARPYGLSFRWSRGALTASVRELLPQYLPLIFAAALVNRGVLIDQAVAATLAPGSVAAFTLGSKLVGFVQGLGATALRAAVLPYFAAMVAEGDWRSLRRTSVTITAITLGISAPTMLALALWAAPLVSVVYQRGAFTADDTTLVAYVHALSVLQIPFFVLFGLVTPLLSALNANRYLVRVTIIAFPLNVFLDYVLSLFFGIAGIVIATTIVSAVTWAYLMRSAHQAIRRFDAVAQPQT